MADDDSIDWNLIDTRLAVADGPEGKKLRDKLFVQLDPNRNRSLSLSEVLAGLGSLLESESTYRKANEVAPGLIPGISDFRPAITAAFKNARLLGNSSAADGSSIDRTEFHALLVFFRHYLELLVIFKKLDDSGDMLLSAVEIMPAIPKLFEKYEITWDKVKQKVKAEPGGKISFQHFAEWCLQSKLESFAFDDSEGLDSVSPPLSPAASIASPAGKGKVDWDAVDARIPTDPDASAERDVLFKKMDVTGSGSLSLTAIQSSMTFLLEGDHAERKKGEAGRTILPGIRDTRPAVSCAFLAARDLAPPLGKKGKATKSQRKKENETVDRREFHALLAYLRYYLELQILFQDLDTSEDNRISMEECSGALPELASWGIDRAAVKSKFAQSKNELKFSNFADWCLRLRLDGAEFDLLEDDQPEDEEEEEEEEEQQQQQQQQLLEEQQQLQEEEQQQLLQQLQEAASSMPLVGNSNEAAPTAIEYVEDEISDADYNTAHTYETEAEVQAACDADPECKGYMKGSTGKFYILKSELGSRTWKTGHINGEPKDGIGIVKVKRLLDVLDGGRLDVIEEEQVATSDPLVEESNEALDGQKVDALEGDKFEEEEQLATTIPFVGESNEAAQHATEYEEGEIIDADYNTAHTYDTEAEVQDACDADSECKGYMRGSSGKFYILKPELGSRTWKTGHINDQPKSGVGIVKVKPPGRPQPTTKVDGGWRNSGVPTSPGQGMASTAPERTTGRGTASAEEIKAPKENMFSRPKLDGTGSLNSSGTPASPERTIGRNTSLSPLKPLSKSYGSLPIESTGVLKRPPHLKHLSHIRSLPKWKFGEKRPTSFLTLPSEKNPAPGSYVPRPPEKTGKFREQACFSFGGGPNRFGYDPHPGKVLPAPGEYGIPTNPVFEMTRKVGFGNALRGNRHPCVIRTTDPGPGAYERKTTLGGVMCTAKGKIPRVYDPKAALPGPGAYHPRSECLTHERTAAKVGFGTATRTDFMDLQAKRAPGPGAYDSHTFHRLGKGSKKCSFSSRHRSPANFDSYVTPGPGSYDGDGTCFGY